MIKFRRIAIICPVYNSIEDLPDLFKSLSGLSYDKKYLDLIMVDNASKDKSVEYIKEKFRLLNEGWRNLILIENLENKGVPGALNKAYEYLEDDIFAILKIDSDIIFDNMALINMLSPFDLENKKDIGIVGCLVRNYISKTNECGAIYQKKWVDKISRVLFPNQLTECDGVLGCSMLIKKEGIDRLDYFIDSNLFLNGDEKDLSIRLKRKGFRTYYQPKAIVYHKSNGSRGKVQSKENYIYYSVRNNIIILKKHANIFKFVNSILYGFVWVLWKKIKGEDVPMKAFLDGLFFKDRKLNE